ncbi:hypothetical protein [Streptomyces sp. NPDC006638]|uniref:hypothetical protein n=1 Tax=Streptomyces sp. NPDC006638 TaxID=3157183 RepID=UPI0033BE6E93
MMSGKDVSRRGSGDAPALFDYGSLPTLELEDIEHESPGELSARGSAYAKEYARVEHQPTILSVNLATVCVALRIKMQSMDGKSHAYREAVREMYAASNIPADTLDRLKGNVRWHISQKLRRYMTPRELEAHGLLSTSALERGQDERAKRAMLLKALATSVDAAKTADEAVSDKPKPKAKSKRASSSSDASKTAPGAVSARVKATADSIRLAQVAKNIVGQISPDVVQHHMQPGQRAKLDEELAELQKTLTALRRLTRTPRSKD